MEFTKEDIFEWVTYKNDFKTSDIYPLQRKWAHPVGISYDNKYDHYLRVFYYSKDIDATNGCKYKDYLISEFKSWKRNKIINNILQNG